MNICTYIITYMDTNAFNQTNTHAHCCNKNPFYDFDEWTSDILSF